jgi:HB1, ASXL, restriction endonuclease HTH domain
MQMTIQEAAHQILSRERQALDSKTIAKLALEQGLVPSSAQDPIASLAQTLEKNIRDNVYNRPTLIFVHEGRRRLISLPGINEPEKSAALRQPFSETQQLSIRIPSELMNKIQLAEQAKIGANFDDSVATLLREGLRAVAPRIKEVIESQLKELPAA